MALRHPGFFCFGKGGGEVKRESSPWSQLPKATPNISYRVDLVWICRTRGYKLCWSQRTVKNAEFVSLEVHPVPSRFGFELQMRQRLPLHTENP